MKELQKFELDIQRYISDPNSVIKDANRISPSLSPIEIKKYLDGRLKKDLLGSIEWEEPLLIQDIIHLNFNYKNVRHRSYVDMTCNEMVVSMIVDGKPLTSMCKLHDEATCSFITETVDGRIISEYGLSVVKDMVVQLLIKNYRNLA